MRCRYCLSLMRLDGVDSIFKGNKDNYWLCERPQCYASCVEEIRFNKPFQQIWHKETGNKVIDETIKLK